MPRAAPARRKRRAAAQPDYTLLADLANAAAISGDEGAVRRLVLDAIRPHVDDVRVDTLGNVLAVKRAAPRTRRPLRFMLAAHMDEVGLMVVDHDSDGSLRFEVVGGVSERGLLGQPVLVGARRLPGVIGVAPVHLLGEERRRQTVKASQMRIDIGAGSQDAARRLVPPGERAAFATEFLAQAGVLRGKALDDRLGCAALVALLQAGPYPVELHAAFTVQEEVGLRGARVAAYAIDPAAGLALDTTPAADLPGSRDRENTRYNARLGAGPVIYVADGHTVSDRRLVDHLIRVAERAGLPYQLRQPTAGGTDAAAIQRARGGVPVAALSTPARYLHTPAALARAADWENTLRLAQAALEQFTPQVLKR
jgi:endoglucanase